MTESPAHPQKIAQEQVPAATPGQVMGDTPEHVTADTQEQVMGATPGQVTADIQGHVTADTPEQVTADTPEQVTADTPEQVTADPQGHVTADIQEQVTADTQEQILLDFLNLSKSNTHEHAMTLSDYWEQLKSNPYFYLLLIEICFFVSTAVLYRYDSSLFKVNASTEFSPICNVCNACLGGTILILIAGPFSNSARLAIITFGLCLEAFHWLDTPAESLWMTKLCLAGPNIFTLTLAFLLIIFVRDLIKRRTEAIQTLELVALASAIAVLYLAFLPSNPSPSPIYDAHLMAADGTLGFQPSFAISATIVRHPWLHDIMYIIYGFLPTWMLLCQAMVYRHRKEDGANYFSYIPSVAFIVTAFLGTIAYDFCPAIGPAAYCGDIFPLGQPPILNTTPHSEMAAGSLFRNAMPSLHFSFIICALLPMIAYGWRQGTTFALLTIGTLISAFPIGHHWLCDFVVALPFVTACIGISAYRQQSIVRSMAVGGGALCTLGLLCALKYNIDDLLLQPEYFWVCAFIIDVLSCLSLWSLITPRYAKQTGPHQTDSTSAHT